MKAQINNWVSGNETSKNIITVSRLVCWIAIACYLFTPSFQSKLVLDAWNQPAMFFGKINNAQFCFWKQVFNIISKFSLGQVFLFVHPIIFDKVSK